MNLLLKRVILAAGLVTVAASTAFAEGPNDFRRHESDRIVAGSLRLDDRYHHNHYYPPRGHFVTVLPAGSYGAGFHGSNYFLQGGVWFRPAGSRFVVVAPPFGILVPLLPPAYVTLRVGDAPYYYANGVYYAPAPGQGYVTVAPPSETMVMQPAPQPPLPATTPEMILYPRNGQSALETQKDRQECMQWASGQPNATDMGIFQRGLAACLDGRGYSSR